MAYTRTLAMQRGITKLLPSYPLMSSSQQNIYTMQKVFTLQKDQALPIKRQALYNFKIEIQHECYTAENSK
jgi:hypothetical protein